jgi:tRNA A37 threonylcarbamoyladenosine modification protein TsaB
MIKDFLIINCTGKKDLIGLKLNDNFFIQVFQTNIKNNDELVNNILKFLKKYNVNIDKNFTIIVNLGPGSFSSIRVSLAVAKGIQISKKAKLYGYKDLQLSEFNLKNIEYLIKNNLLEYKLIKPVYIS